MAKTLQDLKLEIMTANHTTEQWLKLEVDVNEAMLRASEGDIQNFVDSGAGEMLDMACSAVRAIRHNH